MLNLTLIMFKFSNKGEIKGNGNRIDVALSGGSAKSKEGID